MTSPTQKGEREEALEHLLWRLRNNDTAKHLCGLAADEIERLRSSKAEGEIMGALRELAFHVQGINASPPSDMQRELISASALRANAIVAKFDAPHPQGGHMTSTELAAAEAALRLMTCGRTEEAREKLAGLVREAGGEVPPLPVIAKEGPPVRDRVTA